MYIPNTPWTLAFMGAYVVQAVVALALEAYVFGKFQASLQPGIPNDTNQTRTIPTFLAVFMFGYIYGLLLVYDALKQKNTIQVIGLVAYNVGLLIYAAIQLGQIELAVTGLENIMTKHDGVKSFITPGFWEDVKPMLITLPVLMAVFTFIFAGIAWKLYDEFAWTIYKHISADLRLKRRYLTYQIYIALLKFDFFFFLAFTVQFLVVVEDTSTLEKALTYTALGITFILLFLAAVWVRGESLPGMILVIFFYFVALGYFLFKLIRMYDADPKRLMEYKPARKSLTSFAVLTILLLLATIAVACTCAHNFNKGLKPHVNSKKDLSGKQPNGTEMPYVSGPQSGGRMEID